MAAEAELTDESPSISYPSYKSFDEFIDVEQLKALDDYISSRLRRRLESDGDLRFYT